MSVLTSSGSCLCIFLKLCLPDSLVDGIALILELPIYPNSAGIDNGNFSGRIEISRYINYGSILIRAIIASPRSRYRRFREEENSETGHRDWIGRPGAKEFVTEARVYAIAYGISYSRNVHNDFANEQFARIHASARRVSVDKSVSWLETRRVVIFTK